MISIDSTRCIGCGQCVDLCLHRNLYLENNQAVVRGRCFLCGHCLAICPTAAVSTDDFADGTPEAQTSPAHITTPNADALLHLMKMHRTTRCFLSTPLAADQLDLILEAGRTSPTGSNLQRVRFILLASRLPEMLDRAICALRRFAADQPKHPYAKTLAAIGAARDQGEDRLFYGAPAVLLLVHPSGDNLNDCGIAAGRMDLMAASLGVGVCFNGFFVRATQLDPTILTDLGIREDETLMLTMALGYPQHIFLRYAPRKPLQLTRL